MPEGSGISTFTLAHNVTGQEAIDQVMEKTLVTGTRQVRPPQETFRSGYSGWFADPDGFFWEVACMSPFWIVPKDEEEI